MWVFFVLEACEVCRSLQARLVWILQLDTFLTQLRAYLVLVAVIDW